MSEESPPETLPPAATPLDEKGAPVDLAVRLEYLETQIEGMKRVGVLALILVMVVGGFLVHLSWSDLRGITTQGLVLQGVDREFAGALVVAESGHIALLPTNDMRALPVVEAYPGLQMKGLGIYDSKGRLRLIHGVDATDKVMFAVLDENGNVAWSPFQPSAANPSPTPTPRPAASPTP